MDEWRDGWREGSHCYCQCSTRPQQTGAEGSEWESQVVDGSALSEIER